MSLPVPVYTHGNKKTPDYAVIVNPHSAAGRTRKNWQNTQNLFARQVESFEVYHTQYQRHATELSAQLVERNVPVIIAVGGDGTISETAAGFFNEKGRPRQAKTRKNRTALGIIAAGSGSDLIRTLNIPRDIEAALEVIKNDNRRDLDMGLVEYISHEGKKVKEPFINIADVGIGGEVIEILENQGKSAGGWLSYQLASLRGLIQYKHKKMVIHIDSEVTLKGEFFGVIVANGKYFGSGMKVAPGANPEDGLFDIIIMKGRDKFTIALQMAKVRNGSHINADGIEVFRGRKVIVETEDRALLDLDGEQPGLCPAEFSMVENAIPVIVPGNLSY